MSQASIIQHLTSRIKADVDFLVVEGLMSRYDADQVKAKLPSVAVSPPASNTNVNQLASPPNSVASTPSVERMPPLTRIPSATMPSTPVIPPPTSQTVPSARALWGYNEDGAEPGDLSFREGDMIEVLEEVNKDWWRGKNKGREGLFPSSYVEKMAAPQHASVSPPVTAPVPAQLSQQPTHGFPSPYNNSPAPYNSAKIQSNAPPQQGPLFAPPPPPAGQQPATDQPPKKNKFGKYGSMAANSAASGVGFGAGAAIGSGIVNAIF